MITLNSTEAFFDLADLVADFIYQASTTEGWTEPEIDAFLEKAYKSNTEAEMRDMIITELESFDD